MKPRVLIVGRTRYRLPLSPSLARKFDALGRELDVRVLASAAPGSPTGDGTFTLVPPFRLRRSTGSSSGSRCRSASRACCASSVPMRSSARRPTTPRPRSSRGGSRACRRASSSRCTATGGRRPGCTARRRGASLSRLGDAVAALRASARRRGAHGVAVHGGARPRARRRAGGGLSGVHGSRAVLRRRRRRSRRSRSRSSSACSRRTRTSTASLRRGGSRRARVPEASLRIVGKGTRTDVAESLVRDGARWDQELARTRSRARWTTPGCSCCLRARRGWAACSSRRSVAGAASSARAPARFRISSSTASPALLVDPDDPEALADALVRVLSDRSLAERLAEGARAAAAPWLQTPEQYAQRMRELVA